MKFFESVSTSHVSQSHVQSDARFNVIHRIVCLAVCFKSSRRATITLWSLLLAASGICLEKRSAIAQAAPNIIFEPNTGLVEIDNNAFEIQTGRFANESDIPIPAVLPNTIEDRVPLPVNPDILAPNNVELDVDVDYINEALDDILTPEDGQSFQLQPDTLQVTTGFDLSRSVGDHNFGEGIEAVVIGPDGEVISRDPAFVRGDVITIGPDGEPLPETENIRVTYGAEDNVQLRVLNIREDGAQPSESGIYFNEDGELIVEDLPEGGDRDFNDGDYLLISGGQGEALAQVELNEASIERVPDEIPLDPEMRENTVVNSEEIVEQVTPAAALVTEDREYGEVEIAEFIASRLGHARAARTEAGDWLVYDRYSSTGRFRLGSDGLSATGQLAPLIRNPGAPPTLLTGDVRFNPFVGDNEAGFTTAVGVTQFFNRTHRVARDIFGNEIVNPDPDGPRLLEPAGLFNNRRWVGYVPATPDQTALGAQIFPTDGIFDLPLDQAVAIAPSPVEAGRGNAAYTNNVGGLLLEDTAGNLTFAPQWTENGYAQEEIVLEAGEAVRAIYALVPQQPGQALQVGERYAVVEGPNSYVTADGGFTVISADRQPANFIAETAEIYAVEDTLPVGNTITNLFNGIPGVYVEQPGGEPVPTVDVTVADEVDARVGNAIFPLDEVVGSEGQGAFARTTRAFGFYLGGLLTGGIGNQEDRVSRTTSSRNLVTSERRSQGTINTFMTPRTQVDTIIREVSENTVGTGMAFFNINEQGEISNARFVEDNSETQVSVNEIARETQIVRGEEEQVSSRPFRKVEILESEFVETDSETTEDTDSYANFSAVQGELALGGVFNFGNTPWSPAANTVRAELFTRDTVFGRSNRDSETGWRTEVIFHPFGEVQEEAYQYDTLGNAVALYRTEPTIDSSGAQMTETIVLADGETATVPVNQFMVDEFGDRISETVGTGRAKGPGVYLRIEDIFSDNDGVVIAGGLQFAF